MTEDQSRTFVASRDRVVSSFLGKHNIHGVRAHSGGIEVLCDFALPIEVTEQITAMCDSIGVQYKIGPLKNEK